MAKSILLDTNLLVVLVVGLTSPAEIGKHKRTRNYTPEDFLTLQEALQNYQQLWVTSQAVAECSNLIRQTNKPMAEQLMKTLSNLVSTAKESNITSTEIFKESSVLALGVADAGITKKSKRVTTLLTADLDLYLEVDRKFGNAINFNHIRTGSWDFSRVGL